MQKTSKVIIPAFNEQNSVGKVIRDIPKEWVSEIVVVNNNSNDNTVRVAKEAGATVLEEPEQGYGNACLKGIAYISQQIENPHIVVFMDADYSDYLEDLPQLVLPIMDERFDIIFGSLSLGHLERCSMDSRNASKGCSTKTKVDRGARSLSATDWSIESIRNR